MIMVVMMMTRAWGVGTGLRIERFFNRLDMTAETFNHVPDHVIGPDANAVAEQLHRQMAIAQMPCDTHKFAIVMRVDFQQRFRPRAHPNDPAIFKHQSIAVPQSHGLRKVDQQLPSSLRGQHDSAPVPAIEVDQHLIDRIGPGAGGQNGQSAHQ